MSAGADRQPVLNDYPALMTESELIQFLRIPEISTAKDYHNVIRNLVQIRDLPSIKICNHSLYPKKAILQWIEENTEKYEFDASQKK